MLQAGSAAAASGPPPLPRSTTISGDFTGYTEVELTKTLHPLDQDSPSVSFQGGGEFIAAVLRPIAGYGPMLAVFQTPDLGQVQSFSGGPDGALPAGTYRLYLGVVDPGSVTLTFANLPDGTLAVNPQVQTPFEAGPLQPRGGGQVLKFGQTRMLNGGGFALVRVMVSAPPPGAQLELCWYPFGAEASAGDSAYDPGCPGGTSEYKKPIVLPNWSATQLSFGNTTEPDGLGGNMTVPAGSAGGFDVFGMWMSYDFPQSTQGGGGQPGPGSPGAPQPVVQGTSSSAGGSGSSCGPSRCPPGQSRGNVTLSSKRLVARGSRVTVRLTCSMAGPCAGRVRFVHGPETRFAMSAGRRARLAVRAPGAIARRIRRHGSARGILLVTSKVTGETLQKRQAVRVTAAH
jgi:hypothetical protein